MTIIGATDGLTKRDIYKLTMDANIKKMSDYIGVEFTPVKHAFYTDENSKGETNEILSIMDENGDVYATNSATFKQDFAKMLDLFGDEDFQMTVVSGISKNGREFITCALV